MAERDVLLQKYLDKLESGKPLDEVMRETGNGDPQLNQMLILAANLRSLPPPAVDPATTQKQDAIIKALIHSRANSQKHSFSFNLNQFWLHNRRSLAGVSAVLFLLVVFIWVIFSTNIFPRPKPGLTVIQMSGQAEVRNEETLGEWLPVRSGDKLAAGQRLRTGSHSSILLRFPDESQLNLAPNTEILVSTLSKLNEGTLAVELTQYTGKTRHKVAPRQDPAEAYIVHTPTSDAYVQGTTFSVAVAKSGKAYIAVEDGSVSVRAGSEEVALTAGFATYTQAGQSPASPVYAFTTHGELRFATGTIWEVDEVMVYVSDETVLDQGLRAGDYVLVTGRILPNGRWSADTIELVEDSGHQVTFTGMLGAITRDLWLVDDVSLLVTDDTERPQALTQGDLVSVTYTNMRNGRRLALGIARLETSPFPVQRSALMATPQEPTRPSLSFNPDELEAAGCDAQFNLTGYMENSGTLPENLVENVELGFTVLTGEQFVESVVITPSSWEEIPGGKTTSFAAQVTLSPDWLKARRETEVKLQFNVVAETNRQRQHLITRMRITLVQTCNHDVEIPPPSLPAAESPPNVIAPMITLHRLADCTGAAPHPEGLHLAELYQVEYAEIIDWFCRGYGFGEIDLTYNLSQQTGVTVTQIFTMRNMGLGWGKIMKQLGVLPDAPNDSGESPDDSPGGPPDRVEPDGPPGNLPGPPSQPPGRPSTRPGPP
jgi:hypothetical protein